MTILKDDISSAEQQKSKSKKRAFGVSPTNVTSSPFSFLTRLMQLVSIRTGKPIEKVTHGDITLHDVTETHKEFID